MAIRLGQRVFDEAELTAPVIPSIYAAQLVQLAARWHVEPAVLLQDTGIDANVLEQAQGRVTPAALRRLLQRALQLTGEPGLGFYLGLQLKLSSHGMVGLAAMTSATLRDALKVAERFVALRWPFLAFSLSEHGERAVLELSSALYDADSEVDAFVTEALFTALVYMARSLIGPVPNGAVMFELRYPEPAYFSGFAHLWPGPARFEQPANRLNFAATLLAEPLPMADAVAARQALSECERELSTLVTTSSLLAAVRRQLGERERGYPSLTELARMRHVSPRTLKRRLAEQGTSYQRLLDELRRDRALKLLEVESHSVEHIAEQLGYSDAANFNRAFRRWLGLSPSAWRVQHVRRARG